MSLANFGDLVRALAGIVVLLVTALGVVLWYLTTQTIASVEESRKDLREEIKAVNANVSTIRTHMDLETGAIRDEMRKLSDRLTIVETVIRLRRASERVGTSNERA